jgi:hypothetical protein
VRFLFVLISSVCGEEHSLQNPRACALIRRPFRRAPPTNNRSFFFSLVDVVRPNLQLSFHVPNNLRNFHKL